VLPTPDSFPDRNTRGQGIIAIADEPVKEYVLREAERLAKSSPEIVEIRSVGIRPARRSTLVVTRPNRRCWPSEELALGLD